MKLSRSTALVIVVLISLSAGVIFAQQGTALADLKYQIAQLEKMSRSADTPPAMKASSLRLLAEKRAQLRVSLQMQIDSLRNYQTSYGSRLSAKENQRVIDSIRALERDLADSSRDPGVHSSSPIKEKGHATKPNQSFMAQSNRVPAYSRPAVQPTRTRSMATMASSLVSRDNIVSPTRVRRSANNPELPAYGSPSMPLPIDCTVCDLPDDVFVVDASTGKTYWHDTGADPVDNENKTRFSKGERVRVIVINKNPFLFKYNITIQETTITEEALGAFLKVFSPIFPSGVAAAGIEIISLPDLPIPASCPGDKIQNANLAYDSLRNDIRSLNAQIELAITRFPTSDFFVLKRNYAAVSTEYNTAAATFSRTRASAGNSLCADLCSTANNLQARLTGYNPEAEFKAFQTSVENLKAQADAINSKINDFVSSYPECQPRVSGFSALRETQVLIQRFSAQTVAEVLNELNQMREGYKEFVKMRDNLNALASRPDLLQEQRIIGSYNDPTNVTVKVEFKGLSAPDAEAFKPVADAKLNFGGDRRFALSGGVGYGLLERPEYKPILGFERDQQGNLTAGQTAPVSVIGVTDNTKRRIGPMVMLNTRLTNYRDTNLFFSLGITGTSDNTGVNIDYLIGPSVNVLDRKLFLTYGLYGGRVQRLNEGLYLGLKVPDATTPEKLVRKDFIWKSGFAATYKIK